MYVKTQSVPETSVRCPSSDGYITAGPLAPIGTTRSGPLSFAIGCERRITIQPRSRRADEDAQQPDRQLPLRKQSLSMRRFTDPLHDHWFYWRFSTRGFVLCTRIVYSNATNFTKSNLREQRDNSNMTMGYVVRVGGPLTSGT